MKNFEFVPEHNFETIVKNFRTGKISKEKAREMLDSLQHKSSESVSETIPVPQDADGNKIRLETVKQNKDSIAVIGISGQFPKAGNVDQFWENLVQGVCAFGELPADYLKHNLPEGFGGKTEVYRWGGILEERDCFDPLFFQITPREAKSMNPHQRLILQESWKALEDAGINPDTLAGSSAGLFIGAEPSGYFYESFTGYSDAIIASRLSYFLNLHGPAIVVNTACSSSGTAIHLACESLRNRETSLALAGGAYARMEQPTLIKMAEVGMLSHAGVCRAFDAYGDGAIMSEGVGVVVLKRLEDAVQDHDLIYGVIIGSGLNQDGASNGITAPNGLAQEKLFKDVYERFEINPAEITYIEAHGTGTKLGDPVEANSLVHFFRRYASQKHYCALGSAKSHVGHTGAAACVISLIKVLLSMRHGIIPGLINFNTLNPLIEFNDSPFFINTETLDWRKQIDLPLTAAINSFGHSGTNAHIVVREYCTPRLASSESLAVTTVSKQYLILLSARDDNRLQEQIKNLSDYLNKTNVLKSDLPSIAYTLQTGRKALKTRIIFFVSNIDELKNKLHAFIQGYTDIANCWRSPEKLGKLNESLIPEKNLTGVEEELRNLAKKWILGEAVAWEQLYHDSRPARMRLPVYPFAKERYWISIPEDTSKSVAVKQSSNATTVSHNLLLLKPDWQPSPINVQKEEQLNVIHAFEHHCIITINAQNNLIEDIKQNFPDSCVIAVQSVSNEISAQFHEVSIQVFLEIKRILLNKPKKPVFMQIFLFSKDDHIFNKGLAGLLNTARLENPLFSGQVIEFDENVTSLDIIRILHDNSQSPDDRHICYKDGFRYTLQWQEIANYPENPVMTWKENGVYLITGGVGSLGIIFAKEIAQHSKNPVVILTGRTVLNSQIKEQIALINSCGAIIDYKQCDVGNKESVDTLFNFISKTYNRLDGIIQSAGIIRDSYIIHKDVENFHEVLKPKVDGLINLDKASASFKLDFFVLFSSLAGIMGGPGQSDYAAANAFMDALSEYRNKLVQQGKRYGKTISINWPLWQDGGMKVSEEASASLRDKLGIAALPSASGIAAFYQSLAVSADQVLAMTGDLSRLRSIFLTGSAITENYTSTKHSTIPSCQNLKEALLKNIARILEISAEEINLDTEWVELGFDTFALSVLFERLNELFGLSLDLSAIRQIKSPMALLDYFTAQKTAVTFSSAVEKKLEFEKSVDSQAESNNEFRQKAIDFFKEQFSSVINLPVNSIDADNPLEEYGIDSIVVMQLTTQLEKYFGSLSKTIFFEYQTLREACDYFIETHRNKLISILTVSHAKEDNSTLNEIQKELSITASVTESVNPEKNRSSLPLLENMQDMSSPIAIIGLAGKYPQARNISEFWHNLKSGKNCITEIPADRWDHSYYSNLDKSKQAKTIPHWGGFLDDVAFFDPLFFNISPQEAEYRDPQERLFLECVHDVLEDAGYTRQSLSHQSRSSYQNNVGVFVGVLYLDYQLFGVEEQLKGLPVTLVSNASSIANRVSYFFNFNGPSIAMDTMCSSSLTAIHLACQSIRLGECRYAVAGGVNLSIHPNKYLMLGIGNYLSSDGFCKAFGKGGDGYVPAEGVGAVLLKSLPDAITDGDHIYGIIRGTAVNHGGKTNGYSVPNPNAHADVIIQALKNSSVDPRMVSYLEAHGTGTELGDPIEIAGLTKAFREFTGDNRFCAIGSVKSNIGHCESAAGIAGLTKVLLQMQQGQLAPSLHAGELNPNIDFENTPFIVQRKLSPWNHPTISLNGEERQYPRIAGISSFGAGGSNAHIIVEEYLPDSSRTVSVITDSVAPAIIVLSARNEKDLRGRVTRLLESIDSAPLTDSHLQDVAFTLQTGREAMRERLAFICKSMNDLKSKLTLFLQNNQSSNLYYGRAERSNTVNSDLSQSVELSAAYDAWRQNREYNTILKLWINGIDINWYQLYGDLHKGDQQSGHRQYPCRVSLPTYPFDRKKYWVPSYASSSLSPDRNNTASVVKLHPILHQNTSTKDEMKFSSTFSGEEFFLNDHQINGQRVLPGVAYLEMARAAVSQIKGFEKCSLRIKNVIWGRPVVILNDSVKLHIHLISTGNNEFAYEIYSESPDSPNNPIIHSRGSVTAEPISPVPPLNIENLKSLCRLNRLESSYCYSVFKQMGVNFGPAHQGIVSIDVGENMALAKLSMPSFLRNDKDHFVLHPSMMDSALQSSIGVMVTPLVNSDSPANAISSPFLPFALDELEIIHPTATAMWALVRNRTDGQPKGNIHKIDIDLCDDDGMVCVRFKGYAARASKTVVTQQSDPGMKNPTQSELLFFSPAWKEASLEAYKHSPSKPAKQIVIFCGADSAIENQFNNQMEHSQCIVLPYGDESIGERFQSYSIRIITIIHSIFSEKVHDGVLLQVVISLDKENRLLTGLSGLLLTASQENPRIKCQLIELDRWPVTEELIKIVQESALHFDMQRIRYMSGRKQVFHWQEIPLDKTSLQVPWRDHGIYLITGGLGGLGLIFAAEITLRAKSPTLILAGRSMLDDQKQSRIENLIRMGASVEYYAVDISNFAEVDHLIQQIHAKYGNLHGILHSAGIIRDNFIIKKTIDDFRQVLSPKVPGLINLDLATKMMPLDLFILFSSGAGVLGNIGQADYATANAFMDAYAAYRNVLVENRERNGFTLSINWPLWKDGGMQIAPQIQKEMMESTGQVLLESNHGIEAFYRAFSMKEDQVMVLSGNPDKLRQLFNKDSAYHDISVLSSPIELDHATGSSSITSQPVSGFNREFLLEKAGQLVKKIIAPVIKVSESQIETDAPFENYGIDSVMIMHITAQLEEIFGSLSKTLLFEYEDCKALAQYLIDNHAEALQGHLGIITPQETAINNVPARMQGIPVSLSPTFGQNDYYSDINTKNLIIKPKEERDMDIAIVGISGRYPGADTIAEFWDNLKNGKDYITPVPKERWDNSIYFSPNPNRLGKIYADWGGFISGVDLFDARFFDIPEREAVWTDPNERLFLETVWNLFETAGYTRETLQNRYNGDIGVFAGNMYQHYHLLAPDAVKESVLSVLSSGSYIANRVSYFFNFHGPSIAVDAKGSSSLMAIHLACQSLLKGECRLAVAGGVNLTLHPNKYLGLCNLNRIAFHPDMRSFGIGNGYIPSEAVGAVLLKPLQKAIEDDDFIYAIIKSSAVSHEGHTRGFTVPNPKAQARLIKNHFTVAGINPRTISYVEADVSGARLGDLAEFDAISRVFKEYSQDKQYCAMGSVKVTIGDPEAAAGIAQLTKVILQLQHGQLAPSHKNSPLNPDMNWNDSPFYLPRTLMEWKRPVVLEEGREQEIPRRAAIHSVGIGGTNVHLIMEEYISKQTSTFVENSAEKKPQILIFSARTEDQLYNVVDNILHYIIDAHEENKINPGSHSSLAWRESDQVADLAYTLQLGRETMNSRLAVIANTIPSLCIGLETYLKENKEKGFFEEKAITGIDDSDILLFCGEIGKTSSHLKRLISGNVEEAVVNALMAEGNLSKIAYYWSQGGVIPWQMLHNGKRRMIPDMPSYPFDKQRYWIAPQDKNGPGNLSESISADPIPYSPNLEKSPQVNMQEHLCKVASQRLEIPVEKFTPVTTFKEIGCGQSLQLELMRVIEECFELKISSREMEDYTDFASLANYLFQKLDDSSSGFENSPQPIAIYKPGKEKNNITRIPLSEGQKGLWIIHRSFPDMTAYNVPLALQANAVIHLENLEKSIFFTIKKHPILQSVIRDENGEPYLDTIPCDRFSITKIDISNCSWEEILSLIKEKNFQPFNLETGPLMRFFIFTGGIKGDIIMISVHHLLVDGTSVIQLFDTLWNAYIDYCKGVEPWLSAPGASYQDFIQWEKEMLAGPEGQNHLEYWKKQLDSNLSALQFPADYPRPIVQKFCGITLETTISPELAEKMKSFSNAWRINLSVIFLGIFNIVLHRYVNVDDVVIGMPVMGRPQSRFEKTIGYFVNMLPIRSHVSGDEIVIDYLKNLRAIFFEGLSHASFPLSVLIRELNPQRHESMINIFQITYTYQNYIQRYAFDEQRNTLNKDFKIHFIQKIHQEGDEDLALEVVEENGSLSLFLKYNPEIFMESTIKRLVNHYLMLLQSIVDNPEQKIAFLSMLTQMEKDQLLHQYNHPILHNDKLKSIYELISRQALKTPDAIALKFVDDDSKVLTYSQLIAKAEKLAGRLHVNGIIPGDRVGVCVTRSLDMIVGLMAVFASGACFLPLDPEDPPHRLKTIIADSVVKGILVHDQTEEKIRSIVDQNLTIVNISQEERFSKYRIEIESVTIDNPAYVIYTSGSTGNPKGVVISHRSLAIHCQVIRDYYQLSPQDTVLQFASFHVDTSLEQILPGLSCGATIVIKGNEIWTPKELSQKIKAHSVTVIDLPPSYLHEMILYWNQYPALTPKENIRLCIAGGESLSPQTVVNWQNSLLHNKRFINAYGPTEATITSTVFDITADGSSFDLSHVVPIGKPLSNVSAYILDMDGNLMPEGIPGELYIGGVGVALGYLNCPELTKERFITDPFTVSSSEKHRLYRTGDRARYIPGTKGVIEFLGRLDQQIKIRGFRFELGEIENHLMAYDGIKQCAVIVRENAQDDPELIAFVVCEEILFSVGSIKEFLLKRIPRQMVPSGIIRVNEIQLTSSGKLDRRALASSKQINRIEMPGLIFPRDTVENKLEIIWRQILNHKQISIYDDFFDLGGHSLLAVRLSSLIEKEFGIEMSLKTLIEMPNIAQLSDYIRQNPSAEPIKILIPLQPNGELPPLFCIHPVGGTVYCYVQLSRQLGKRQPLYAIQSPGCEGEIIPGTLELMASLYISAIRSIQKQGPYNLCGWSFGGVVAYEIAQQLKNAGEEVSLLFLIESYTPSAIKKITEFAGKEVPAFSSQDLFCTIQFAQSLFDVSSLQELPDTITQAKTNKDMLEAILQHALENKLLQGKTSGKELEKWYTVFQTNYNAMNCYEPRPYLGDVIIAAADGMDAILIKNDPMKGWGELVQGNLIVHSIPGDHISILKEPNVQRIAHNIILEINKSN